MALRAYVDESFEDGGGVYALAGYLGQAAAFDGPFQRAWDAEIRGAPHHIDEFKASDCRLGFGQFTEENGWSAPERLELTKRLVSVIETCAPRADFMGIGGAFVFPKGKAPKEHRRYVQETGLTYSLLHVLLSVSLC